MDHLFRFQRRMHIKLTPVVRNGGQIQPPGSVIMILVEKSGNLVRQKEIMSCFPSFQASPRKMFSCLRAS